MGEVSDVRKVFEDSLRQMDDLIESGKLRRNEVFGNESMNQ